VSRSLLAWPAGETGFLVDVPDDDPALVAEGLQALATGCGLTLVDVVPGLSTVLVVFAQPLSPRMFQDLLDRVEARQVQPGGPSAVLTIEVRYDGPDLAEVAELSGLDEQQVIDLHTGTQFRAAFSGFAPGFVYLTGVPQRLMVARRAEPRAVVPGGSVALADRFTAVYPRRSPGGWRLIGRTSAVLWDTTQDPPAVIRPGMSVRFRQVD